MTIRQWTCRTLCLILTMFLGLASSYHAESPGEVRWHEKIGAEAGGFIGPLDPGDQFGGDVARLGDLDGDGVNDLAVGAIYDDDGESNNTGAVWILFLNSDGTVEGEQKISDTEGDFDGTIDPGDRFSSALAWLGDLGPGAPTVNALAVGAFRDSDGAQRSGAVWILFLRTDGTVEAHQKISNTEGGFTGTLDHWDQFGISAASLGDVDGDGVGDLAVGAIGDDGGDDGEDDNTGAVWILFLNADGTVKSHQKISATEGGFPGPLHDTDSFGISVDSMGDFDGDGVGDLVVGSHGDDDEGENRGSLWVLALDVDTGETDPEVTVKWCQKISDTEGNFPPGELHDLTFFGSSVASLGDFDGDGVGDVAAGGLYDLRGAVWILFLNGDATVRRHQRISDTEGNFPPGELDDLDFFAGSAASLGDFDGDGVGDLVVGAPGDDDGGDVGSDRGAVWLLFLNKPVSLDVTPDSLSWGPEAGAIAYDVIRGDLESLLGSEGDFVPATEECLADDHPDPSLDYALSPNPGECLWFLVRRRFSMLSQGTYDTCSPSQVEGRDAEIAASGADCP